MNDGETEKLKQSLNNLPNSPGCYLFYDKNLKLLYVGKAASLKKRVNQYFRKNLKDSRVSKMTSRIRTLETINTKSEYEAFVLEQNLIKQKKPIFNILLTDSKKYPYIQLKNYIHPRFEIVRNINPKKGVYFGPIVYGQNAYTLIELLNFLYPFRKCTRLPKKKCIYLDLKQCLGPCINSLTPETYLPMIKEVKRIFSGDIGFLKKLLLTKLNEAIEKENFLLAKKWKTYLNSLSSFKIGKSEFKDLNSHHAIVRIRKGDWACYLVSFFLGGKWMGIQHTFIEAKKNIKWEFEQFLLNMYKFHPVPSEIIISEDFEFQDIARHLQTKIVYPKKGFKKEVIEKARINANEAIKKHLPDWKRKRTLRLKGHKCLEKIMKKELYSIFMVDNSHIQFQNYVSAYVCFIDGIPKKEFYRYVDLSQTTIRDDTEALQLSIRKMFKNYAVKTSLFCDLLLVDGSLLQVNAAKKEMEKLNLDIPIIGISKDEHHKTSKLILNQKKIIDLEHGPLLHYLSTIQDEAHRFANTYFQNKKEKEALLTTQEEIKDIGQRAWHKLMERFQTLENLRNAPLEEIKNVLNEKKALHVFRYFNNRGKEDD